MNVGFQVKPERARLLNMNANANADENIYEFGKNLRKLIT